MGNYLRKLYSTSSVNQVLRCIPSNQEIQSSLVSTIFSNFLYDQGVHVIPVTRIVMEYVSDHWDKLDEVCIIHDNNIFQPLIVCTTLHNVHGITSKYTLNMTDDGLCWTYCNRGNGGHVFFNTREGVITYLQLFNGFILDHWNVEGWSKFKFLPKYVSEWSEYLIEVPESHDDNITLPTFRLNTPYQHRNYSRSRKKVRKRSGSRNHKKNSRKRSKNRTRSRKRKSRPRKKHSGSRRRKR